MMLYSRPIRSTVVVATLFFCFSISVHALIIDEFSTPQTIPTASSSTAIGSDIIGDERDANLRYNYASADINITEEDQLYYNSGFPGLNYIDLVYDGQDGSYENQNLTGLGSVDLTDEGESNALIFEFTDVPPSPFLVNIWVTFYQGESEMGHLFTSTSTNGSLVMLFDDFNTEPWTTSAFNTTEAVSLIDFTDVGYIKIEMTIFGTDDDMTLDTIRTGYIIPEPATCLLLGLGSILLRKKRIS